MNKRYNNVDMLKRNIDRIHTAPHSARLARDIMAQIKQAAAPLPQYWEPPIDNGIVFN